MRIIRPGIAEMRYRPQRRPSRLGFECKACGCVFETQQEEATPVCLYGNYGRIVETVYTCACPNCNERVNAESYEYDEKE